MFKRYVKRVRAKLVDSGEMADFTIRDEEAIHDVDVVRNLNSVIPGKVLDATQGKILNDKISAIDADEWSAIRGSRLEIQFLSRYFRDRVGCWVQQGFAAIDSMTGLMILRNEDNSADKVVKINFITGNILKTSAEMSLGHANDATYNAKSGYLEVAISQHEGIARIDVDTLELVDIKTQGSNTYTGISYDYKTEKLYCRAGSRFYKLDPTSYLVEGVVVSKEPENIKRAINQERGYRQGMFAYNGLVGTLYSAPDGIVLYDFETGDPVEYYTFPKYASGGAPFTEIESLDCVNDSELIMATNLPIPQAFKGGTYIFKADLKKSTVGGEFFSPMAAAPTTQIGYYVDARSTSNIPNGSKQTPFRYVQEAIYAAMANQNKAVLIELVSAGDYGPVYIAGLSSPIRINGVSGATLDTVYAERATSVDLRTVTIKNSGLTTQTVYANQAQMIFRSVTFNAPTKAANYYIVCTGSSDVMCVGGCSVECDDTSYLKSLILCERGSTFNGYSFSTKSTITTLVDASYGSHVFFRDPNSKNAVLRTDSYINPSLVTIAEAQSISAGSNVTLSNLKAINSDRFDHLHNFMTVELVLNNETVTRTFRLVTTNPHLVLDGNIYVSGSNWIHYYVKFDMTLSSSTIKTETIRLYQHSDESSSYSSPTVLTSSSAYWPKLKGIYLFRV